MWIEEEMGEWDKREKRCDVWGPWGNKAQMVCKGVGQSLWRRVLLSGIPEE
jgi:hypothetical protein